MIYSTHNSPWLVFQKRKPDAVLRLFCFHYGGGSASAFKNWEKYLPSSIELVAIQLPGREGRFNEPFITQMEQLVDQLCSATISYLDKPFAVYGHSLGALVGFEWIRALAKNKSIRNSSLFIPSGMPAPHTPLGEPPIADLPEDEFVEELLKDYKSTLGELLHDKEIREIFIPQLRADFKLLETYSYCEGSVLDCPIVAFVGDQEEDISEEDLCAWSELTSDSYKNITFSGDHFFIHSEEKSVLEAVNFELQKVINNVGCSV